MTLKMKGFREILLRKAKHDPDLQVLIKCAADEVIADYTLESLEKMAQKKDFLGRKGNHILHHFGAHMEPDLEGDMLHDAVSHHASKWKKAMKSGNEDAARGHASRFVELMNFAHRVKPHSGGKLDVDAPDLKLWEQNHYHKVKEGASGKQRKHYSTEAKGWHTKASKNAHDFMRQPPHWSYQYSDPRTYNKYKDSPYPIEDVKINGKHLHIDDSGDYEGDFHGNMHEFDHHPAIPHTNKSAAKITDQNRQAYVEAHHAWDDTEHKNSWLDRHEKLEQEDPNYHKRGLQPPKGLHDHALDRVHHHPYEDEQASEASVQPAAAPKSSSVVRKPKAAKPSVNLDMIPDDIKSMMSPEDLAALGGGKKDE